MTAMHDNKDFVERMFFYTLETDNLPFVQITPCTITSKIQTPKHISTKLMGQKNPDICFPS